MTYLSNLTHTSLGDSWVDVATCSEAGAEDVGDHCLVLSGNEMLRPWNQYGGLVAEKSLTQTVQGYYPFGANAHTLCVGELVGNSGQYSEEIVVATNTGLMWLHVDDLLSIDAQNRLPATGNAQGAWASGFWLDTEKALPTGVDTHVQARTNETMASAWAIARRPDAGGGLDDDLHVLDQRGAYWKIDYDGNTRLFGRTGITGTRGWDYIGPVSSGFPALSNRLLVQGLGDVTLFGTDPWFPRDTLNVGFEQAPSGPGQPNHRPDNWIRRGVVKNVFEGFIVHIDSGGITTTSGGQEAWWWSALNGAPDPDPDVDFGPWGNLLQGISIPANGAIDGIWASSNEGTPSLINPAWSDSCPYFSLRNYVTGVPIMAQQSVHPVRLTSGVYQDKTAVVLGCPGGRVRVLLPGEMRHDDNVPHELGYLDQGPDLGYGGSALAVRHVTSGTEELVIWLGTVSDPALRPASYADPTASLDDGALSTGAVHRMRWVPGQGFVGTTLSRTFHPETGALRGAHGVVGLLVTDLEAWPGEELLVATMSGDLIVCAADSLAVYWRTHVDGAIGFYNAIVAADLNDDDHDEIYVAGSKGLWRFLQPGETQ